MKPFIRSATEADAEQIVARLHREENGGFGFWHNRHLIRDGVSQGELAVVFADGRMAGFLRHSDTSMDIMEIWPEFRGRGLGRKLAEFGMERIYNAGELGILIECAPPTSIPFWKRMGFLSVGSDADSTRFAHVPQQQFTIPADMARRHVTVASTPWFGEEACRWERSAAVVEGVLRLEERITKYVDFDIYITVSVDGKVLYGNKAKYDEAAALGIQLRGGFLRIDHLNVT